MVIKVLVTLTFWVYFIYIGGNLLRLIARNLLRLIARKKGGIARNIHCALCAQFIAINCAQYIAINSANIFLRLRAIYCEKLCAIPIAHFASKPAKSTLLRANRRKLRATKYGLRGLLYFRDDCRDFNTSYLAK